LGPQQQLRLSSFAGFKNGSFTILITEQHIRSFLGAPVGQTLIDNRTANLPFLFQNRENEET